MCYKSETWIKYLKKSKKKFDKNNIIISNNNDKEVVLIESRQSIMIEYVIKNVMYFLHRNWNLTIIHGHSNRSYLNKLNKELGGKIRLVNLGFHTLNSKQYSKFLTSTSFYDIIQKEIFLIIQLDVIIFKNIDPKFFKYSYIGAPWEKYNDIPCGNGGFSLRNKNDMLKIINSIPYKGEHEDMYFSKGCVNLKLDICPKPIASDFSSETMFNPDSIGVHKPHFGEEELKIYVRNVIW